MLDFIDFQDRNSSDQLREDVMFCFDFSHVSFEYQRSCIQISCSTLFLQDRNQVSNDDSSPLRR